MGYGFYTIGYGDFERPCGYMVLATCDKRGCDAEIDRGMGWLCGETPHDPYSGEPGCGRYFCAAHLGWYGPRGGCSHRGKLRWGVTLSCMTANADGSKVCLDRWAHFGPHAWETPEP